MVPDASLTLRLDNRGPESYCGWCAASSAVAFVAWVIAQSTYR